MPGPNAGPLINSALERGRPQPLFDPQQYGSYTPPTGSSNEGAFPAAPGQFSGLQQAETNTREATVNSLLTQFQQINDQLNSGALPPYIPDPAAIGPGTAALIENPEYVNAVTMWQRIGDNLAALGIDPYTGAPTPGNGPGGLSANVSAQIGEQRRQFDISQQFAEQEAQREQQNIERQQRLDSVLNLLDGAIQRGDLTEREATRQLTAAVQQAGIQRDILSDFGGKALPQGTPYFPGFEPGSAFGQAISALSGRPFEGFATQGTFQVSPNAITAPIGAAGAAPGGAAAVSPALAAAQGALSGQLSTNLNVIPPTPQQQGPRISQPSVLSAQQALGGLFR